MSIASAPLCSLRHFAPRLFFSRLPKSPFHHRNTMGPHFLRQFFGIPRTARLALFLRAHLIVEFDTSPRWSVGTSHIVPCLDHLVVALTFSAACWIFSWSWHLTTLSLTSASSSGTGPSSFDHSDAILPTLFIRQLGKWSDTATVQTRLDVLDPDIQSSKPDDGCRPCNP